VATNTFAASFVTCTAFFGATRLALRAV